MGCVLNISKTVHLPPPHNFHDKTSGRMLEMNKALLVKVQIFGRGCNLVVLHCMEFLKVVFNYLSKMVISHLKIYCLSCWQRIDRTL